MQRLRTKHPICQSVLGLSHLGRVPWESPQRSWVRPEGFLFGTCLIALPHQCPQEPPESLLKSPFPNVAWLLPERPQELPESPLKASFPNVACFPPEGSEERDWESGREGEIEGVTSWAQQLSKRALQLFISSTIQLFNYSNSSNSSTFQLFSSSATHLCNSSTIRPYKTFPK